MSLIPLKKLKKFIHMKETDCDDLLQDIIDGEIATAEDQIKQPLQEDTTTEYEDGDHTNMLILEYGLVTSIESIKIDYDGDGTFEYELTEHEDYEWKVNGEIFFKSGYFPEGVKNVEVVYKHGYADYDALPPDLRLTLMKMMANTFSASYNVTESEGESKKFAQKPINKVLGKYTRLVVA